MNWPSSSRTKIWQWRPCCLTDIGDGKWRRTTAESILHAVLVSVTNYYVYCTSRQKLMKRITSSLRWVKCVIDSSLSLSAQTINKHARRLFAGWQTFTAPIVTSSPPLRTYPSLRRLQPAERRDTAYTDGACRVIRSQNATAQRKGMVLYLRSKHQRHCSRRRIQLMIFSTLFVSRNTAIVLDNNLWVLLERKRWLKESNVQCSFDLWVNQLHEIQRSVCMSALFANCLNFQRNQRFADYFKCGQYVAIVTTLTCISHINCVENLLPDVYCIRCKPMHRVFSTPHYNSSFQ